MKKMAGSMPFWHPVPSVGRQSCPFEHAAPSCGMHQFFDKVRASPKLSAAGRDTFKVSRTAAASAGA
jgi:hypothetical protein